MAAQKDNRSIADKAKAIVVGAAKQTVKDVVNFGAGAGPEVAGVKIGATAGKAIASAIAKDVRPELLKDAAKARGLGAMKNPEPALGNKVSTAAKRDVVVKTDDKVIPVKDKGYINKTGEKSVKVNTDKPTVRVIKKEVTRDQADNITRSTRNMIQGGAKKEASRMESAVSGSKLAENAGAAAGAIAGAAPAVAKGTQANHHVTDSKNHTRTVK